MSPFFPLHSVIDADGNTTISQFDAVGDLTSEAVYDSTSSHALFASQSWKFDKAGNETQHIDTAGHTTDSTYDGDELTQQSIHVGSTSLSDENWEYDLDGNVTEHTDINDYVTTSIYDGDQLVGQKVYEDGTTLVDNETWGHDTAGNLTSQLDNDGNVTDQIDVIGSQTRETRYAFEFNGNMDKEIDGYGSSLSGTILYRSYKFLVFTATLQQLKEKQSVHEWIAERLCPQFLKTPKR